MRRAEGLEDVACVGEKERKAMLGGFAAHRKARVGRQAHDGEGWRCNMS